ncbi:MAG: selenocysteine-specific translation elongation factor [Deltaproteobacteria bacterium]|nr:MAG: selenocysteine-specific translation elongation factor [Deltaproteobacteria bacterium]
MKRIVLGTAGHIDHGKTALVTALTGIDTDRLKEEKLRGITIELGFASLKLPSGNTISIVDVPGHEKFVKNMVAGASGIDIVALIVAADEGVMPQTREHLDICRLLNVKKGIVVITKIDLVDDEMVELVKEDIKDFIKGTFLESAPIIPVSSVTGKGLKELVNALDKIVVEVKEKQPEGLFRLPIDRIFTMKGFGTVVTGTLISGQVEIGDEVEILPEGVEGRVRGIQVHNQPQEKSVAGLRTALNLQGVEKTKIYRGDVVCHPDEIIPTNMMDVWLQYLKSAERSLKDGVTLRFHVGTALALAKITLFGENSLEPGEACFARLKLDKSVVALPGDRFVIRSSGIIQTVGGGIILDTFPYPRKRKDPDFLHELSILKDGTNEEKCELITKRSGFHGVELSVISRYLNLTKKTSLPIILSLQSQGKVIIYDKEAVKIVHKDSFNKLKQRVIDILNEFHNKNPLKTGMIKEELKAKLYKNIENKLFVYLISSLEKEKKILVMEDKVSLPGKGSILDKEDKVLLRKVEDMFLKAGLTPPGIKEVAKVLSTDEKKISSIIEYLFSDKRLVKTKGELYFHVKVIEELKNRMIDFIQKNNGINTQQFKEITGVSRKYAIPLLEYFDNQKVTLRVGEKRILRGQRYT